MIAGGHLAERHELFIILALGESVVAIGVGLVFAGVLIISLIFGLSDYFTNPPEESAAHKFHEEPKALKLAGLSVPQRLLERPALDGLGGGVVGLARALLELRLGLAQRAGEVVAEGRGLRRGRRAARSCSRPRRTTSPFRLSSSKRRPTARSW